MKQEDKELLLKDLCARLQYGIICEDGYGNVLELNGIDKPNNITFKCSDNTFWTTDLDKCKPYLFPLSSMTVEQRCKVQNLLPNNCDISFKNQKITFYNEGGSIQLDKLEMLFNFFNLYHIDYRGLIEKGLALDATGLNIY